MNQRPDQLDGHPEILGLPEQGGRPAAHLIPVGLLGRDDGLADLALGLAGGRLVQRLVFGGVLQVRPTRVVRGDLRQELFNLDEPAHFP
jgi:hypothetical protein